MADTPGRVSKRQWQGHRGRFPVLSSDDPTLRLPFDSCEKTQEIRWAPASTRPALMSQVPLRLAALRITMAVCTDRSHASSTRARERAISSLRVVDGYVFAALFVRPRQ
jgi:hypothetical protein